MTAEDYLKEINWWDSGSEPDGKFWADQWQLAEAMEIYAQRKLVESGYVKRVPVGTYGLRGKTRTNTPKEKGVDCNDGN